VVSRVERSAVANWWWTVDRWLLVAIGTLIVLGLVLTMAASPPVAARLGLSTFHFVHRQALYLVPTIGVLIATSFLTPRHVRRAALLVFAVSMGLIIVALVFGHEVKGSKRWILGVQPSEFLKPAFVILAAWAFSEGGKRRDVPGNLLALLLLPITIVPLILQPDFGQTMLISLVWAAMFFMAGLHWFWVAGIGGVGLSGALLAYKFVPHVRARILKFIDPGTGGGYVDTFQVDTALDSFLAGSWFGKGPGEGTVKRILPDAHTDFIFAVTGEEFGIVTCLILVSIFGFIVLRGLIKATHDDDAFCRFAAAGLLMMFGLQSAINMAVNLHLMPAKGMTLPFISYGGSSLISLAIGMGFLVAVTRSRPHSALMLAMPSDVKTAAEATL
jgi:cell division protein FtsW